MEARIEKILYYKYFGKFKSVYFLDPIDNLIYKLYNYNNHIIV